MPKVSVIMPVYNGEKYLKEAIESILNQTATDLELIIIDDGSVDSTSNIINSFNDERIKYFKNEKNSGISFSLNRALDLACGEFIARMDADDISLPSRLETQIKYMQKNSEIEVCGCNVRLIGTDEKSWPSSESSEALKVDLIFNCCLAHPTVMFRKSVVQSGEARYNSAFDHMEDYELWTRLIKSHKFGCVQDVLFEYRIHPSQTTQNHDEKYIEQMSRIKRRLINDLKLEVSEEQFWAYLNFCLGNRNECDSILLREFFIRLLKQNKKVKYYNHGLLIISINAVLQGTFNNKIEKRKFLLSNLPVYMSPRGIIEFITSFL